MPCGGRFNLLEGVRVILQDSLEIDKDTAAKMDQSHCPDCGLAISKNFTWCPGCGYRLFPYQCDYCGGQVPRNADLCPRCGAPAG